MFLSNFRAIRVVILAFSLLMGSWAWAQDVVPGEYLVKMKGRASSQKSAQFVGKISSKANLKATFGKLNLHHLSMKAGQDAEAFLNEIRQDPDVDYVEPNYILRKVEDGGDGDSRTFSLAESEAMINEKMAAQGENSGQSAQGSYLQSGANTKVSAAWTQMSTGASDIPVVAVIDTGIDYNHRVFRDSGALWLNPGEIAGNGIDDDGNGYVDDVFGWNFHGRNGLPYDDDNHGTHVAGIVLGVTQNIFANPIQAAKIRIMPLKFLGADGSGSTSDAIQAIYYATNNGANVINNSWGGSTYSQSLHDAMTYAYQHHVTIVSAAGNYGSNNDGKPLFPASYPVPSNISVAATNDFDSLASFSNFGRSSVHMAAPGVAIWSTVPNGTRYMSGTSMAAPFVAGLAALALREAPDLTGYQVANLVINSGSHLSQLNDYTYSGNRADTLQSLIVAKANVGIDPLQPEYVPMSVGRGLASEEVAPKAGCGSVGLVGARAFKPPQGPPPQSVLFLIAFSLVPLMVWQVLRTREQATGRNRRQHERFVMNSEIKVKIGERELVGQMNTISMGGASFKADALLERGGIVTLQIASPDGGEQVSVEGRIVWNEQNQAYGVQFQDAKEGVLNSIQGWTAGLNRAS
ncbi:MAG: S8 family serine peptidase [Bdellovibrionaceae bacterium]|nr:S8 family serine peptidase [Pseudobdellovibrionaceae bacterium]